MVFKLWSGGIIFLFQLFGFFFLEDFVGFGKLLLFFFFFFCVVNLVGF